MKTIKNNFAFYTLIIGLLLVFSLTAGAQDVPDNFDPNADGMVNSIVRQTDGKILIGGTVTRNFIARLGFAPAALGNYPATSVALSGNANVTPDAAPTDTVRINVSTDTIFKGIFAADPTTGVIKITDAHPAGTYTVTVTAFNSVGAATSTTFQLTVNTGTACNGTTTFTNAPNNAVDAQPFFVGVGDFNNDGKQDLAVAHYVFAGTVSILLGNGAGGFSAATSVAVNRNPRSVAVGDFDGDGKQDLAVPNQNSSNVSILKGDGTGGFTGTTNVTVGDKPLSVAVGDFNGDGKQDFASSDSNSANVSIRLGMCIPSTAASVSIAGRVITPQKLGLTRAFVTLTDMQGNARTIRTGKFGSYRFADLMAGETYILTVKSKRYTYAPQMITVNEEMTEVNFTAQ